MHQIHIHRRNDHHRRDSVGSEGAGDGAGTATAASTGGGTRGKASRSRLFELNLLVSSV